MNRKGSLCATVAAALVLGGLSAQAGTLSPPGWINGSGNPQDNFTVTTTNGVELGLRAKYRHNPDSITPAGDTYTVVAGPETNQTNGGNGVPNPLRAAWNYEYSINLNPTGGSSLTLAGINAYLTVTDPNGHSGTAEIVDPINLYTADNTGYGLLGEHVVALPSDWLAQNSENPSFGNFPVASFYNQNTTGTYTFTLDIKDKLGNDLATDTIHVDVVPTPLPTTAWAGLGLLGGIGVLGRVKRRQRQTV